MGTCIAKFAPKVYSDDFTHYFHVSPSQLTVTKKIDCSLPASGARYASRLEVKLEKIIVCLPILYDLTCSALNFLSL